MAGKSRRLRILQVLVGAFILLASLGVALAILSISAEGLGDAFVNAIIAQLEAPPSGDASEVTFVVHPGETAAEIGNRLEKERLVRSALLFRLLARSRGLDEGIEAGEHRLRRNMTMGEILATLQSAATQNRLTMLEGWRAAELAEEVEFRGIATQEEFLALVQANDWPQPFLRDRPPGVGLEGYLFPDTYAISQGMTARDLIEKMLANFAERVLPAWERRSPDLDLNLHEALTLASIVEREARVPAERPLIAGVFLNRLRQGMLLQADPTVQYALAPSPRRPADGWWKPKLTTADLALTSPYNTYRSPGLPPGPICSPGLPAVEAVLHPAPTDYLYFVAKGDDGTHAFARTLAEHDENVQRYQR